MLFLAQDRDHKYWIKHLQHCVFHISTQIYSMKPKLIYHIPISYYWRCYHFDDLTDLLDLSNLRSLSIVIVNSYRQYNNISLSHQSQFLPICQTEVLSPPDISFNLQNNESIRVVLKYSVHSKWWSNQRNNESWDIRSGTVLASMTSDVQCIAPYNKYSDPW